MLQRPPTPAKENLVQIRGVRIGTSDPNNFRNLTGTPMIHRDMNDLCDRRTHVGLRLYACPSKPTCNVHSSPVVYIKQHHSELAYDSTLHCAIKTAGLSHVRTLTAQYIAYLDVASFSVLRISYKQSLRRGVHATLWQVRSGYRV